MHEPIPVRHACWRRAVRIVPSCYPPIDPFEEVADSDDLEAVFAVESLTNPRIRTQVGSLSLVPEADRISGPGTSPIMAAFTHPNTAGSRFSPGSYGIYYAADDEQTAVAETRYH
ncbi:MAG: RES family NAD+ phosphorylase, partial [Xanthomonadaceae bacterium]|nr:RES family NAD+ phosphorylase [Xanthomonadaceae bacterium]